MVLIRCDTQLTIEFLFAQNVAIEQRNGAFRTAVGVNVVRRIRENPHASALDRCPAGRVKSAAIVCANVCAIEPRGFLRPEPMPARPTKQETHP